MVVVAQDTRSTKDDLSFAGYGVMRTRFYTFWMEDLLVGGFMVVDLLCYLTRRCFFILFYLNTIPLPFENLLVGGCMVFDLLLYWTPWCFFILFYLNTIPLPFENLLVGGCMVFDLLLYWTPWCFFILFDHDSFIF
ncbi:unnamed protein product [Absidia cylindrospora]